MSKGKFVLTVLAAVCMFASVAAISSARQDQNMNANSNANANANRHSNSNRHGNTNGNMSGNMSGSGGNMNGTGTMLGSTDRKFMMEAAAGGMAEVAMGRLATERAASDSVKQYAQHMIDDHTKANEELMQVATAKGVTLPTGPDAKHQAMMAKMQGLSGAAFDREYVKNSGVNDHKKMEKLFQKESGAGQDAETKAFAAKTLPTVQEHLRMAQDLSNSMMGTKSNSNSSSNSNMTH